MSLRDTVIAQFRRPHGALGYVAGRVMAARPSNRQRNLWTVELLDIKPDDTILEVGCGPGVALKACLAKPGRGAVTGLDHSAEMLRQTKKTLRQVASERPVHLIEGGLDSLHTLKTAFTKIFCVNVVQFYPDRNWFIEQLAKPLEPGGQLVVTYMPRTRNPTQKDAYAMAADIERAMDEAGLRVIKRALLPLEPAPAISVIGQRP